LNLSLADIVLVSSSEPDGKCFVETSQLDGETNLKARQSLAETCSIPPETLQELQIQVEPPNNSLYTFNGTLNILQNTLPLKAEQLLLRGCQLKNTEFVWGVVCYTGSDTKLVKNSSKLPIKQTKLEKMVNKHIIMLFIILLVIAFTCAAGGITITTNQSGFDATFIGAPNSNSTTTFFKNVLTFIVLFNNLIPLSLVITMEFVKLLLAYFVDQDIDLYYERNNTRASARSSSLIEELGQVDYIFSDKTGTLTCNIMEFKMASVNGISFGEKLFIESSDISKYSPKEFEELKNSTLPVCIDFLRALSICHTVVTETEDGALKYQSSSPDELALVQGANNLGCSFHSRTAKSIVAIFQQVPHTFEILAVNEFTSTRKRMSILVKCPIDNVLKLYVKGADNVILERLLKNQQTESTLRHLKEYAQEGLRTLCIACKIVSEEEARNWLAIYHEASTSIDQRLEKLAKAADLIEQNLSLLGATGIEDKLQDQVPETISRLMNAGIKIWVLTGDRQDTAINIGYSCKLLKPKMTLLVCNETSITSTLQFFLDNLEKVRKNASGNELVQMSLVSRFCYSYKASDNGKFDKNYSTTDSFGLIIDGKTLDYVFDDTVYMHFLKIAILCEAVICCRVSPLQKAKVLSLIRKNVAQTITLAIGDGANDVTMIQASHIGIGISGEEGLQAARLSDFSIAQFRFLEKLLLVHGVMAYSRLSKVILFSFYKNITLYMLQLWYTFYNGFSGHTLFETWSSVSSYNVLWTLLAPLVLGIFDKISTAKYLLLYPQLYSIGQKNRFYNNKIFFWWFINSILHSLGIFFLFMFFVRDGDILMGRVADNWVSGQMIYAVVLATVLLKTILIIDFWVLVSAIAVFGSFLLFFLLFPIYAVYGAQSLFGKDPISPELFNLNSVMWGFFFWFTFALIPVAVTLLDFTILWYCNLIQHPSVVFSRAIPYCTRNSKI
jgi:phospholipid-transporting ATPase